MSWWGGKQFGGGRSLDRDVSTTEHSYHGSWPDWGATPRCVRVSPAWLPPLPESKPRLLPSRRPSRPLSRLPQVSTRSHFKCPRTALNDLVHISEAFVFGGRTINKHQGAWDLQPRGDYVQRLEFIPANNQSYFGTFSLSQIPGYQGEVLGIPAFWAEKGLPLFVELPNQDEMLLRQNAHVKLRCKNSPATRWCYPFYLKINRTMK